MVYAAREARWIVEAATGRRWAASAVDGPVDPGEERRALELARRRAGGEPLQYVTGVAGFRHLELRVGPGVFIPRPETELVAERAMELLAPNGVVVEIGTGSGAIALSIAHERPDARVLATELSEEALAYARSNASELGLNVELLCGDLFSPLPGALRGEVDVIVSNPPYVPLRERHLLPRDVVAHEPHEALFAAGDGLGALGRLAQEAPAWLRGAGRLVLEIGDGQGNPVRSLLNEAGLEDVRVRRDLTGRERIAEGTRAR